MSLLAHQFIGPLAVIDSSAQRLARLSEKISTAEIERRSLQIRAMTDELTNLARSLLGRIEDGMGQSLRMEKESCDLSTVLLKACDHARCFQPNRLFLTEVNSDMGLFSGDPLLLEQLFSILLCNAAKYSPARSPVIVKAGMDGGAAVVQVIDSGIGVPRDEQERIFQPFYRASNAHRQQGTGIGLALACQIARLHGGGISLQSEEGRGSTFTVRLPVRPDSTDL